VPAVSKACKSFTNLPDDLDNVDPTDSKAFDQDAFQDIGDAFKKAAKKSPKKVKSALNTLGSFYQALGGSDNAVDALQEYSKSGKKFTKALTKFSTFYATSCL
jgi:hypothetical protein